MVVRLNTTRQNVLDPLEFRVGVFLLLLSFSCVGAFAEPPSVTHFIFSTSRSWINFRHGTNALMMNRAAQAAGVPPESIFLWLAEVVACNMRNNAAGRIYYMATRNEEAEIFRGAHVFRDGDGAGVFWWRCTLQGALQARRVKTTLATRQLSQRGRHARLGDRTRHAARNVLIYFSGHGGENFMKVQNVGFYTSEEFAVDLEMLRRRLLVDKLLVILDTCRASSMCVALRALPNVLCVGSTNDTTDAFATAVDYSLGVFTSDEFTQELTWNIQEYGKKNENPSLRRLFRALRLSADPAFEESHFGLLDTWTLRDFFPFQKPKGGQADAKVVLEW